MRDEAIRNFRRSWKPKSPARTSRANRAALTLVKDAVDVASTPAASTPAASVEQAAPRVSLANPLPPLSRVALAAACRASIPDCATGVRLRPQRDSELLALSELVETLKAAKPARPQVAPPPPPTLPYRKRNSRDATDPNIEILATYRVPPVPLPARNAQEWVEVCSGWIEDLSDPAPSEALDISLENSPFNLARPVVPWRRAIAWSTALIAAVSCLGWLAAATDRQLGTEGVRPTPAIAAHARSSSH